ncbi:MFS transporter [Undibacterium sp. TJN25]|uniref:MFS transporter n=1 Tax=Undibacterium sp. TJN25 TaxID=3413056 RepID=UPI003BF3732A
MTRAIYLGPVRNLFLFSLLVLLLSQAAISLYAWSAIEKRILPVLDSKAATVGDSVARKIQHALDYRVPFEKITGVTDFFDDILQQNPDIAFLALCDARDKVLFSSGIGAAQAGKAFEKINRYGGMQKNAASFRITAEDLSHNEQAYVDTSLPVLYHGELLGVVHIGVEQHYIAGRISELRYDIGIILLTSLLIAFEILQFIIARHFSTPIHQISEMMEQMAANNFSSRLTAGSSEQLGIIAEGLNALAARINHAFHDIVQLAGTAVEKSAQMRESWSAMLAQLRSRHSFAEVGNVRELAQPRVNAIRILTFLFMFAEMLSRPFLPLYAGSLPVSFAGLPASMQASLPISCFLLAVALSMPFAGSWSDRLGRRRSFMLGALTVAAGMLLTGLLPDFSALVAARTMTGVGYAVMFMACQGYVIDHTDASNRTSGMASFVGAIMVAEICAPAVGGILADRIGYQLVFIVGALVALTAAGLAVSILDNRSARPAEEGGGGGGDGARRGSFGKGLLSLAGNYRFVAMSLLTGIPAKLIYSGFLIYLVPMLLADLGSSKSEIGRYAMLYGFAALLLSPLFARFTDRHRAHTGMVAAGGILTGAGLLPVLLSAQPAMVLLGISCLGIGQAMSISAQLVLVARLTRKEAQASGPTTVLGIFRLIERLGAAAGPALAAALVASQGTTMAMAILGIFGLVSACLFALLFAVAGDGSDAGEENPEPPPGARLEGPQGNTQ